MIFPFLRYKTQTKPCIAKGPSIKGAREWYGYYEKTRFSLALPPSNAKEFYANAAMGRRFDRRAGELPYEVNRWTIQSAQHRRYRFWGPRGVGEVKSTRASVFFTRLRERKPGVSLFNPRVFEYEVIDYIEDRFTRLPKKDYMHLTPGVIRAPINWQAVNRLPGPAACFVIDTAVVSDLNYYFATTLDDYDLLFVAFRLVPNTLGPKHIPPEEWVDLRHMRQLIADIYDSVKVELSPEAEANRLRAIKGLQDTCVAPEMDTHHFQLNPYYDELRGRTSPHPAPTANSQAAELAASKPSGLEKK